MTLLQMSNLATIDQLSRDTVASWITTIVEEVEAGNIDKYFAVEQLKQISAEIERGEKQVKVRIMDELEGLPNQTNEVNGFTFKMIDGRQTFDFSNDAEWQVLNGAKERRETDLKNAYKAYLKTQKYFNADGEQVPIPSVKGSKAYLRIEKSRK